MEPSAAPLNLSDQEQGLSSSIAFQAYVFFLTMLGVLVQVKLQDNGVSPIFHKYNTIISTFVVAISIYIGTVIVGKRFRIGIVNEIIGVVQLMTSIVAPILLLLILVPKFGWLLLVLWILLTAKMAWDYLWQQYHYLFHQISDQLSELFGKLMTRNLIPAERPQGLPV